MTIQDDIAAYARKYGLDPTYALSVASRESSFNPNAHASKTIDGLFQMSGPLRQKYGVPTGADVETQVKGFADFTRDLNGELADRLGRQPSNSELYLAHYWGAPRAAAVLNGQGDAPTSDLFTPAELAANPNLATAGETGASAARKIVVDMNRRQAKFSGYGGPQMASEGSNFAAYGQGQDDDGRRLDDNYARNKAWLRQGAGTDYQTKLTPDQEQQFRGWVEQNKVPFNPDGSGPSDYDMRGFWQGLQNKDPHAESAIDPNDGKLHYPDWWKTPYHETFSAESQWADPKTAPSWNDKDQLVAPGGKVLFDDRAPKPRTGVDFGNYGTPVATNDAGARSSGAPDFSAFGSVTAEAEKGPESTVPSTAATDNTGSGAAQAAESAPVAPRSSASPQSPPPQPLQAVAGIPTIPGGNNPTFAGKNPQNSAGRPGIEIDPAMFGVAQQQGIPNGQVA